MVVYLLIFVLIGVEGKMFYLMVMIVVMVFVVVMVLIVMFILVVVVLFIGEWVEEKENWLMGWVWCVYELVFVVFMMCLMCVMIGVGVIVLVMFGFVMWFGSEFILSFNEGDLVVFVLWIFGMSLL